ncbi:MAG: glycosyltransferase family 9 protein [Aestuariibacter sp.]
MRLSAIGDVCHAAAMVQRIIEYSPEIEITWIIGKVEHQLLKGMANVRFVIFDKRQGSAAVEGLRTELQDEYFDALFLMQVAFRANWVSRVIKAKMRIGFDWARSKELHWLFARKRIAAQKHAHVLEGFMGFADAIGVPHSASLKWDIPLSADEENVGKSLKAKLDNYMVISPAASKAERNWLPERYAAVADHAVQKGFAVVICGGPAVLDKTLGQQIQSAMENSCENWVGKTSLKEMLAILKYSELVLAPDTGPAHMATTVGTPVIGLYAHSNPRRTGPFNDLDKVVSVYDETIKKQTGKNWDELPWGKRAKGEELMARIDVDTVITMFDKTIQRS